jgi:hypothetical protein
MAALRCTAKLLDAMKAEPVAQPAPSVSRLGDWTANLIRVSRVPLVLAVNDRTRFGIIMNAAPYADITFRFAEQLFKTLLRVGIPGDQAAAEAEALRPLEIAATHSRSVLGTLNEYAQTIRFYSQDGLIASLDDIRQRLEESLVLNPKDIVYPLDRVREAFNLSPINRRMFL